MLTKALIPSNYKILTLLVRYWGPEEKRKVPSVTQESGTHRCSVSLVTKIRGLGPLPTELSPWLAHKAFLLGAQPCARYQEVLAKIQGMEDTGLFQQIQPTWVTRLASHNRVSLCGYTVL